MIARAGEDRITEEQFAAWQSDHKDEISAAAAIAEKSPEERSPAEAGQYDMFVEEVRKVIPGSDQLSAEQLRGLAINLDLSNTRYTTGQIRSLSDANAYVGSGLQDQTHQPIEEGERLPYVGVDRGRLGELAPAHTGGEGQERGKGEREL